jgi:hypothetical protein
VVAIAVVCVAFAGGCRSLRVRPGLITPRQQVAHERKLTATGERVTSQDVDSAGAGGSSPWWLRRDVEMAAATILWLVAGGTVAVTLDGTFEENELFGGEALPAPDRGDDQRDEEPGAEEEPPGPAREPPPEWLVPPKPP